MATRSNRRRRRPRVLVREMVAHDSRAVLEIERLSWPPAWRWDRRDFLLAFQRPNLRVIVSELADGTIAGFCIFTVRYRSIRILNLSVHPEHRLRGHGRRMVDWLGRRLNRRRNAMVVDVIESDLAAQKFFHRTGFLAIYTIDRPYRDSDLDAYRFARCYQFEVQWDTAD